MCKAFWNLERPDNVVLHKSLHVWQLKKQSYNFKYKFSDCNAVYTLSFISQQPISDQL